jgi:homoserine kinase
MAKLSPITFHVPASAANLGPGYGVLAVALDLPLHVTIETRTDGEILVESGYGPGGHLEDPRHDPVVRGFRAGIDHFGINMKGGATVRVEGTIPRGTGLGTISAGFAAGLGAAVRLAKSGTKWSEGQILDQLVPLGGDPAHGAASLLGGLCATVPIGAPNAPRRHRPLRHPVHDSWRFVVAMPDLQIGTAESKRVLPPTLPHGVAARTAGRVTGILTALADGDEELLAQSLYDEIHVPYRKSLFRGMSETLQAAQDAGAASSTICGHGPSLLALTTDEGRTAAIAKAMVECLQKFDRSATTLSLQVAHYGALPIRHD